MILPFQRKSNFISHTPQIFLPKKQFLMFFLFAPLFFVILISGPELFRRLFQFQTIEE